MSLDMGGATAAPNTGFALTAPAPAVIDNDEQVTKELVPTPEAQTKAVSLASSFVDDLVGVDPKSPQFGSKVDEITGLGARDIVKASSASNTILERRPQFRLTQDKVNNSLTDLRNIVVELDPNRTDLDGVKKLLKLIPGGKYVARYFAQYETHQAKLNDIVTAIHSGRDGLLKDNAAIEIERRNLWQLMASLRGYIALSEQLDQGLLAKIGELQSAGNSEAAQALEADALFAVRQRRQALTVNLAASMQSYMALTMLQNTNKELTKAADNATTTTVNVLRTAVIISEALDRQKLVLDQIDALNQVTGDLMVGNAERLRTQGLEVQKQAAEASIPAEKLAAAFDNVITALDEWDTFRVAANDSILKTLDAMQVQIDRAKPYVERLGGPEGS